MGVLRKSKYIDQLSCPKLSLCDTFVSTGLIVRGVLMNIENGYSKEMHLVLFQKLREACKTKDTGRVEYITNIFYSHVVPFLKEPNKSGYQNLLSCVLSKVLQQ